MPAYEARRGPDPMNDPNYLIQLMQRDPHDPLRQVAEQRLQYLQHRQVLGENIAARQQALMQNLAASAQARGENLAQRQARAGEVEQARRDTLEQRQSEASDRAAYRTLAAIPNLQYAYPDPKQAQAVAKTILDQYMQREGIPTTVNTPIDAATEAARRDAAAKGEKVAPTAQAPTTTPVAAGGARPVPAGPAVEGEAAPGAVAPSAGPTTADLFRQGKEQALAAGKPYVEGGQVYGGPAGQDYNVSTGEWMPSNLVGTINGRPAGQAIAEGAMRTGINPESRTGMAAMRQMTVERGIAGGNPPPSEAMTPTPLSPAQQLATGVPPPSEPPPMLFGGPPGANALVGPQPNPTPAGTPAPALGITKFETAPTPTPAGTPPAVPLPGQVPSPQEMARRLVQKRPEEI